jgi:hypothetical protein
MVPVVVLTALETIVLSSFSRLAPVKQLGDKYDWHDSRRQ